jgi:two-component system sensor histidine kinase UhpB
VQEQLNNITKYAKAKEAVITLKTDNSNLFYLLPIMEWYLTSHKSAKGICLKNTRSRVAFYSANMNIISAPGKGCTLEVYNPR